MSEHRAKIAVPAPFFHPLDYLSPGAPLAPGTRVQVPLGRRQVVGIVLGIGPAEAPHRPCRPITAVLDVAPLLPPALLALCAWTADYYQHPIGEVLATALPAALRRKPATPRRRGAGRQREEKGGAIVPEPTPAQAQVLDALQTAPAGFQVGLIEGVTGSGKTEIYLRRVEAVLANGGQALVLTPEIGLTPQLLERFVARFGDTVATLHSGLGDRARADTWNAAREGRCGVLIGTRSAVFTPMPRLGLIVVDEEHDPSYKQQEGLRYSARDVAVVRAQQADIPVLLGSATPSLESLHNAERGRYHRYCLPARAGAAGLPRVRLVDLRGQRLAGGLSPDLIGTIAHHLDQEGQVLLYANRRGYAPALLCHDCGWFAPCPHCDARLTLHRARASLLCHHCGSSQRIPTRCAECGGMDLVPVGQGTERIEETLRREFPLARVERIDSDRARRAGELERLFADVHARRVQVLVGTQMLAKGHDFPGLSLVGVVDGDQALYSTDFRAIERLGQLLTQVAGRAGRGALAGEVLVQTHQPDHPQLQRWLQAGYAGLTRVLLEERRASGFPPFAHLALLRADALGEGVALDFLRAAATRIGDGAVEVLGPVPAPMERRANRVRAQLLLRSPDRRVLQQRLSEVVPQLGAVPGAGRVRWSIDVDPVDLY